ncbi:hypothetical protein [Vibrio sp. HN007]
MSYLFSTTKIVIGAVGLYYGAALIAYLPDLLYRLLFEISMM